MSKTKNSEKTISVNSNGIIISYVDNNKHQFIRFDKRVDYDRRNPKYQEFDKPVFNQKQSRMFMEAIYGLSVFPEKEIESMPRRVIFKIAKRSEVVQKVINRWKQEIVNQKVDNLLLTLFPNSPLVKKMINTGIDDNVKCTISAKDLGLNDLKVADKLVSLNLLPKNFFQLS